MRSPRYWVGIVAYLATLRLAFEGRGLVREVVGEVGLAASLAWIAMFARDWLRGRAERRAEMLAATRVAASGTTRLSSSGNGAR